MVLPEFPFHLFPLGQIHVEPFVSDDLAVLIMTCMTREQDGDRRTILPLI